MSVYWSTTSTLLAGGKATTSYGCRRRGRGLDHKIPAGERRAGMRHVRAFARTRNRQLVPLIRHRMRRAVIGVPDRLLS